MMYDVDAVSPVTLFQNPSGILRFLKRVSKGLPPDCPWPHVYYHNAVLYLEWCFDNSSWTIAYSETEDFITCFKNRHQLRQMTEEVFWNQIRRFTSPNKRNEEITALYYYYTTGDLGRYEVHVDRDSLYSPLVQELCMLLQWEGIETEVLYLLT